MRPSSAGEIVVSPHLTKAELDALRDAVRAHEQTLIQTHRPARARTLNRAMMKVADAARQPPSAKQRESARARADRERAEWVASLRR